MADTARLNLDFYRKQAKALLKAARAGDAQARQRLGEGAALHDAQRLIARDNGFASWARFKTFIVESGLDFKALVARFLSAATSDGRLALQMLAAHPEFMRAGFHVALVLGDAEAVAAHIAADPQAAREKSGPENCEPIVYVCFSRFGHAGAARVSAIAQVARLLLAAGADPNTAVETPDGKLPVLYAASGVLANAELAALLLEAGADPNDSESLYHATEHADHSCMKLLLAHGAKPDEHNALKHILDREDVEGLRLLLEAKANPDVRNPQGMTALHWAVMRDRSITCLGMLLDAGADIEARRGDGRTAYAMAKIAGQTELATFLAARGASTALSDFDASVMAGTVAPNAAWPDNQRLLVQLAENGAIAGVEALLAAGVPANSKADGDATALHYACWRGNAAMVRLLLGHGARTDLTETMFNAKPSGWLHHGARNHPPPGGYADVARLLLAANAPMENMDGPTGNEPLDAVLREAGIIA